MLYPLETQAGLLGRYTKKKMEPVVPADDDHDDKEDTGDGDGDKEHNEGRHTGEGSSKILCIRQS